MTFACAQTHAICVYLSGIYVLFAYGVYMPHGVRTVPYGTRGLYRTCRPGIYLGGLPPPP
jgi:hypothetical protein